MKYIILFLTFSYIQCDVTLHAIYRQNMYIPNTTLGNYSLTFKITEKMYRGFDAGSMLKSLSCDDTVYDYEEFFAALRKHTPCPEKSAWLNDYIKLIMYCCEKSNADTSRIRCLFEDL